MFILGWNVHYFIWIYSFICLNSFVILLSFYWYYFPLFNNLSPTSWLLYFDDSLLLSNWDLKNSHSDSILLFFGSYYDWSFILHREVLFYLFSKLLFKESTYLHSDEFTMDTLFLFILGLKGHYFIFFYTLLRT